MDGIRALADALSRGAEGRCRQCRLWGTEPTDKALAKNCLRFTFAIFVYVRYLLGAAVSNSDYLPLFFNL